LEKYCNNYSVINYALYLKNSSNNDILSRFVNAATEECPGYNISWKNMMYLWKLFIEDEKIPNIFFNHSLKQLLLTHYSELNLSIETVKSTSSTCAASDHNNAVINENIIICNRTSKHLPFVCTFISYWENNISCFLDNEDGDADGDDDEFEEYELEIDELLMLFNKSIKKSATTLLHNNVSDKMLLGLIRHFYPDVIIEDDKYLIQVGINAEIWNKRKEIEEFLTHYKEMKYGNTPSINSQSLYSIYQSYCKYAFDKGQHIISKRWFEKYFVSNYDMFLIDNAIVSSKWFQL
jgi:hypothetical protein